MNARGPGAWTAKDVPHAGAEDNYKECAERSEENQPGVLIQSHTIFVRTLSLPLSINTCYVTGKAHISFLEQPGLNQYFIISISLTSTVSRLR